MKLKPLDQQVVVVMGASSGIGRETARRFAARGANVVVSARDEEALTTLVGEIGGTATAVPADTTDPDAVQAVADHAVSTHGRLDTWAQVAGVGLWATFEQTTIEEFRRVLDVNFMGHVYAAKAALPYLRREGRGALVHVTSVEAKRAFPLHSAYSAAKHAADGLLETLRVELRHEGVPVSVTQILPGSIDTPIFDKARTKTGHKPMGPPPFYEPGTVADMILHAAEHGGRDLYAGGAARAMALQQRLSPRVMDALLTPDLAWRLFSAREAKSEAAPDNLFSPVLGHGVVRDGYKALHHSASNWLARAIGR